MRWEEAFLRRGGICVWRPCGLGTVLHSRYHFISEAAFLFSESGLPLLWPVTVPNTGFSLRITESVQWPWREFTVIVKVFLFSALRAKEPRSPKLAPGTSQTEWKGEYFSVPPPPLSREKGCFLTAIHSGAVTHTRRGRKARVLAESPHRADQQHCGYLWAMRQLGWAESEKGAASNTDWNMPLWNLPTTDCSLPFHLYHQRDKQWPDVPGPSTTACPAVMAKLPPGTSPPGGTGPRFWIGSDFRSDDLVIFIPVSVPALSRILFTLDTIESHLVQKTGSVLGVDNTKWMAKHHPGC